MYPLVRNLLGGALLIAFAAGSFWLARPPPPVEERGRTSDPGPPGGFYLEAAEIMGTDDAGRIVYRISAARARELPGKDELDLEDVRVEYGGAAEEVPWVIAAANGRVPKDRSRLELRGGVRLENVPAEGERRIAIETEEIRIDPTTYIARADGLVTIDIDGRTIRAAGLEAHLKEDRLRLESNVHGQFLP